MFEHFVFLPPSMLNIQVAWNSYKDILFTEAVLYECVYLKMS